MSVYFNEVIENTLRHEGGFVDHASDPGGATNWGMSLRYLLTRGDLDKDGLPDGDIDGDGDVDIGDIKKMTKDEARLLYYTGFWEPNLLHEIESYLLPGKIFDMAVNMGSKQTWRLVQRAVNDVGGVLKVDGIVGPKTIAALNENRSLDYEILRRVRDNQLNFYKALINQKPKLEVFKLGWFRRSAY